MTNDDDRTELASALLDGTLPDGAAAAARRDPAVMARLAQLERARDRVRDLPPPVEGRDAMLAAALEAFDTAPPASPVSDLQARRRARGERRQAPRWLGAAAAMALVLAGVGVVAVLGQQSEDHDDSASSVLEADDSSGAGDSADERSTSAEAETEAGQAAPEAPGTTPVAPMPAPAQLGELGSFATTGDLVARVRDDSDLFRAASDGADASLDAAGTAAAYGCAIEDLPGVLQDADSVVVALGSATVDGEAVSVWVAQTASGRRVILLDSACRSVANRALE
jgi:hypothetical protein